jgi:tetratricopeptide (TPR) repeat protein
MKMISLHSVKPMNECHALALFRRKLGNGHDEQNVSELIQALDYMPLAISQAAAYIRQKAPRISISRYISNLNRGEKDRAALLEKDLGDSRRDQSASNSIIATWQISFEYIQEQRPSAARLLSLMSFFDRQGISESLLHNRKEEEEGDDGIDYEFEDHISTLRSYSLIGVNLEDGMFEIHRLVQFSTRKWLEMKNEDEKWKEMFISKMSKALPGRMYYENWGTFRLLAPHAELALAYRPQNLSYLIQWTGIMHKAAWYAWEQGKYSVAEKMGQDALRWRETILGKKYLDTIEACDLLGLILSQQGKLEAAVDTTRQTPDFCVELLGEDHPATLVSLVNLAALLEEQGNHEAAEKLIRRALDMRMKLLGECHVDTLLTMNNLASALREQGKYEAAAEMIRRALDGRVKLLGHDHPETLTSMNDLAQVLNAQGKYAAAEEMHRHVLAGYGQALGSIHWLTLTSMNNLALVFQEQGNHEAAEEFGRQALEGRVKVLGENHPDVLVTLNLLALILQSQGKFKPAEDMCRQALEGRMK